MGAVPTGAANHAVFGGAMKLIDDIFHANHPLSDVSDAYRAIGERRAHLIQFESQCASQIMEGTLADLTTLVWP